MITRYARGDRVIGWGLRSPGTVIPVNADNPYHPITLDTPTLIVGAGPTGLTLAIELARRGSPVSHHRPGGRADENLTRDWDASPYGRSLPSDGDPGDGAGAGGPTASASVCRARPHAGPDCIWRRPPGCLAAVDQHGRVRHGTGAGAAAPSNSADGSNGAPSCSAFGWTESGSPRACKDRTVHRSSRRGSWSAPMAPTARFAMRRESGSREPPTRSASCSRTWTSIGICLTTKGTSGSATMGWLPPFLCRASDDTG